MDEKMRRPTSKLSIEESPIILDDYPSIHPSSIFEILDEKEPQRVLGDLPILAP
jgi:hypothetical protein